MRKTRDGRAIGLAIGALCISGATSGKLVAHYVGTTTNKTFVPGPGFEHASHMWYWVGAIGVTATVLMIAYDRMLRVDRRSAA